MACRSLTWDTALLCPVEPMSTGVLLAIFTGYCTSWCLICNRQEDQFAELLESRLSVGRQSSGLPTCVTPGKSRLHIVTADKQTILLCYSASFTDQWLGWWSDNLRIYRFGLKPLSDRIVLSSMVVFRRRLTADQ